MLTVLETGAPTQAAAATPLLLEIASGAEDDVDPASVARALRTGLESEFRTVRAAALAALAAAPPILDAPDSSSGRDSNRDRDRDMPLNLGTEHSRQGHVHNIHHSCITLRDMEIPLTTPFIICKPSFIARTCIERRGTHDSQGSPHASLPTFIESHDIVNDVAHTIGMALSAGSGAALLFMARYDPDEDNRAAAVQVWEAYGLNEADLSEIVAPAALLGYLAGGVLRTSIRPTLNLFLVLRHGGKGGILKPPHAR
jgi:hypothetical protein